MVEEFSEDPAPVPVIFAIAAGADDMEQDATETELGELSEHINRLSWSVSKSLKSHW